ncbi:glycosyltransferase [Thermodesulfobacteriota bacterium]
MENKELNIAMLSIHSSPVGQLGTRDTGGMSVYIRELAKVLGDWGHRVDIFTGRNDGNKDPVFHAHDNVRIIHLIGGAKGDVEKSALYEYLPEFYLDLESFRDREKIKYDIIHSHYWLSGVLGIEARLSWEACLIHTYHTIGAVKNHVCPEENESEVRLSNEERLGKHCDLIIVPTAKERNYLARFYETPREKVRVVPCGVNLERFKPVDKSIARQELGMSPDDLIVLYVGRHTPIKGLDRLLEAFSHMTPHPRLRLVMVGGDEESSPVFQQLQSRERALNIQKNLVFAGRVEQKSLPLYYSAADVLAVPSHYESFGLVALEALACGTPVVTTPVGDIENIVQDGITGCVAFDTSPGSFAECIESVLKKQQTNGFSFERIRGSVTGFTWEAMASKMFEAYQELVRG